MFLRLPCARPVAARTKLCPCLARGYPAPGRAAADGRAIRGGTSTSDCVRSRRCSAATTRGTGTRNTDEDMDICRRHDDRVDIVCRVRIGDERDLAGSPLADRLERGAHALPAE